MELTILGGSAAGPNPGQGCSGYLVESGTTRVVVDLGPGTFPELR
jgi:ribonuclease BN (tRNA processing enzyme)